MNKEVPSHVGIIMDGNRRWAKQKGLEVKAGHKEGVEALERVVKAAAKLKVKYLTVYALSTENIKERKQDEIGDLFSIMRAGFITKLPLLKKQGVKVKFFGDIKHLPLAVKHTLSHAERVLSGGRTLQLNIAINYGSRAEIIQAIEKLRNEDKVTQETFSSKLYSKGISDPDLIIRTGGQKRLSNFLLWQTAYSELYFTDKLWPDFSEQDFQEAVKEYEQRKRNFGS